MKHMSSIVSLPRLIANLSPEERELFERIFRLDLTVGEVALPDGMQARVAEQFGSVDEVRRQRIVKVTNHVTMEGALFNALRARRPHQAPPLAVDIQRQIEEREGCDFCHARSRTPADRFGRIQGKHSITASNIAKYDGWHAVIIFDEHNPLRFSAEQVADYVDTAQAWAQEAHGADPEACYPFFLWNCLWRAGASILHGHAQMALTRGMHYARVDGWRQAALRYKARYGANYFADLVTVYRALGVVVDQGTATIFPSLTPTKEKETYIVAPCQGDDLNSAIYRVLDTFIQRLEVRSFNLALCQPPLADTPEDWGGFPYIVRVVDRGQLSSQTSDVAAMEFFAQSVVATDPFRVADAFRRETG